MRHMDPTREPIEPQANSVPRRPRPGIIVGPVVIHDPSPINRMLDELHAELRRNPCVAGHRPAYLARGGIACGVCGRPM